MNRIYIYGILILVLCYSSKSQSPCGCPGAPAGGIIPPSEITGNDFLKAGNFRATLNYRYMYGDNYYNNDININKGKLKYFRTNYTSLNLSYHLTNYLSFEGDLGYYPYKIQDFYYFTKWTSGFSHTQLNAKVNIYRDTSSVFEFTVGAGGRVPLGAADSNLPQHVQPSTGAYGIIGQSIIHKGFKNSELHFFLANRYEYNTRNENNYQYGQSLISSLFISKKILNSFSGILELRNEYRMRDKIQIQPNEDSGGLLFVISPQIGLEIGDFFVSAAFDYPVYQYYNGSQLARAYSTGFNVTWNNNFLK